MSFPEKLADLHAGDGTSSQAQRRQQSESRGRAVDPRIWCLEFDSMRTDGAATRKSLIDAGERLFATRGLDVPLSEIQRAAGLRNKSGLQYHFQSRDGLLRAILEERIGLVEAERCALLDDLVAEGRAPTLVDYVRALVVPLANRLRTVSGRHYLLLMPQTVHLMRLRSGETVLPDGLERTMKGIRGHLGNLDPAEATERMTMVTVMNAALMADRARQVGEGSSALPTHEQFVELAVAMLSGALTAD